MTRHYVFGLLLVFAFAVNAQTINIRGKISNQAGQAVSGAIVELVGQKVKDTTASDGMYSLAKPSIRVLSQSFPLTGRMALNGDILELALGRSLPVKIEVFDVRGNLLRREAMANAAPGEYRWNFSEIAPSGNLMIIHASIGGQVQTFRHLPLVGSGYATRRPASADAPMAFRLAKAAAAVDTLKISASGFSPKTVALSSYDSTVDVTLDSSSDRWGGLKNPPGKSAGCGKATTVTNGKKTITSTNQQRTYIIDIPANYDMNKPYRLFYCSHWIGSTSEAVRDQNYYFLKPLATAANDPGIYIAPQSDGSTWQQKDHALFDDILEYAKANLCIDTTRVFTTGFSFGGMITYSLSTNHQKKIRAGAGIAPANYNIWLPNPKLKEPIAWMHTTGMGDGTCPWINGGSTTQGAKFIAIEKATDNGCTIPATIPIWQQGSHVCYDFQGCKTGYPTKACTFNGGHTNIANDPGSSANWIPQESWKFFTQF